ncbi:MAG TPA: hypothetical protein VFH27_08575, partial [Longimicrobiaceae bacterium]|nr:hypothetical protein [Longimicrobiaceae bacterium]
AGVLAALAVTATAACAQRPVNGHAAGPVLRQVAFGEFTRGRFLHDLPLRFALPAAYIPVSTPGQVDRTLWMSRADSVGQAADPEHAMKDGYYSVRLSMGVGYDRDRRQFMAQDMDARHMKAEYASQGFTNVSVERYEVNGYPVLFVEGDKAGRHAMLVYVAALVDTNTLVIFYSEAHQPSATDRARRAALKQAILGSGRVRRVY